MRWVGHVTRMGKKKSAHRALACSLKAKEQLEDLCVDGRIILTLKSLAVSLCTTTFNIQKFYLVLALH